jgi:hypothetical protein
VSGISNEEINLPTFGTPSDTDSPQLKKFYELDNDPQIRKLMEPTTTEDEIKKFLALYANATDRQLYNAIKAPSMSLNMNRQSLNNSATSYRQAADIMQ